MGTGSIFNQNAVTLQDLLSPKALAWINSEFPQHLADPGDQAQQSDQRVGDEVAAVGGEPPCRQRSRRHWQPESSIPLQRGAASAHARRLVALGVDDGGHNAHLHCRETSPVPATLDSWAPPISLLVVQPNSNSRRPWQSAGKLHVLLNHCE